MDNIPHDLLILFAIILGLSTWVLSWSIKRLRKALYKAECEVSEKDRILMREDSLMDSLASALSEQDKDWNKVDAILEEMRTLHNSS